MKTTNSKRKRKDYSFARFFNPHKSPSTLQVEFDKETKTPKFTHVPKHFFDKRMGRIVWNSAIRGTYQKKLHGELK